MTKKLSKRKKIINRKKNQKRYYQKNTEKFAKDRRLYYQKNKQRINSDMVELIKLGRHARRLGLTLKTKSIVRVDCSIS
jgi:hypothetical protein